MRERWDKAEPKVWTKVMEEALEMAARLDALQKRRWQRKKAAAEADAAMRRSRLRCAPYGPLPLELRAGLSAGGYRRRAVRLGTASPRVCARKAATSAVRSPRPSLKENTDALSRIADKACADQFAHESAAAGARAAD